ncbi:MAG: NAD(+)/NADH kinase [Terriglobales bacterium]
MKTVAIMSKPSQPELVRVAPEVVDWLTRHGYEVLIDQETGSYLPGHPPVPRDELAARKPEFVLVLGGDGTLLAAARALAEAKIPVLGVNLGTLGFLTEVSLSELYPTLEAVAENCCAVEVRSMLHCHLMRNGERVAHFDALNDAVIHKSAMARILELEIRVDDRFVASYRADGLIVATPTGSTAYSLAAGGPVVSPEVAAFIITPISPHMLTHRPVVVKDTRVVTVLVIGTPEEAFLTVDGQVGIPVFEGDRITCRKSVREVRLLRHADRTFFDVLRMKLKWGER